MPQMPPDIQQNQQVQQDMSVILVTAGCRFRYPRPIHEELCTDIELAPPVFCCYNSLDDHTIRFWEAWSGICGRTINQQPHWVSNGRGRSVGP